MTDLLKQPAFDLSATIESLEGNAWGAPRYDSHLVKECHRLRTVPLGQFTAENLRIMIGQAIGLEYLVPLALERLEQDPWTSGDYSEGDLLMSVLRVPADFWASHSELLRRLTEIVSVLELRQKTLEAEILPAWRSIFGAE